MRIAVFIKSTTFHQGYGGLETQNKVLCEGLSARGHEIVVFSPQNGLNYSQLQENGVTYVFIPAIYRLGIFFEGAEKWFSVLASKIFNTKGIFSEKGKEDWLVQSYETFKKYHTEKKFDVVLCQSAVGIGIIRHKKELNVKVISISHGTILGEFKTRLKSTELLRLIFSPTEILRLVRDTAYVIKNYFGRQREFILHSNRVIAVSSAVKSDLVEETFVPGGKVVVIHNGINFSSYSHSDSAVCKPGGTVDIVYIGRLIRSKGLFLLVNVLSDLKNLPFILHIYGDGEDKVLLEKKVAQLGLSSKVLFHGSIPHEQIVSEISRYDIFVLPSLRKEGFPMTIVEAMFAGLPIIASDIGGIPDAVDETNGCLVEPGSANEIKEKLEQFITNEQLRISLGLGGKIKAENQFSLKHMLDKYEQVLTEVLA